MRSLAFALLLSAPLCAAAQGVAPTAQQVVDRIEGEFSVTFPPNTVDTFKAGAPNTRVTGIATTFLPTMSVLRRAVAQHLNFIITHEPTFYNHRDDTSLFADDVVYGEKLEYIRDHHLVIFRMHDTMHAANPDWIYKGFLDTMRWKLDAGNDPRERFVTLAPVSVQELAHQLAAALNDPAIRVVGDPALKVTHAAIALGAGGEAAQIKALEHPGTEVLIAGEASEWETVEYVRDAALEGRHMALILLGHNASEEIGMKFFAAHVQRMFPALPVKFVAAGEPYWPLEHPTPMR